MTPFAMRLEMIKMAMNYLQKRHEHEEKMFDIALGRINNIEGENIPKAPKRITIGEILKLANRFNRFVSDNGQKADYDSNSLEP